MDNKEVRSSESCGARKVKGSSRGGVGEFGDSVGVGSLGVRGVALLLLVAVLCFRNCRAALRPCRRKLSASNAGRHRHRWYMSRQ